MGQEVEADLNLDGLLDGFDDEPVDGIPDQESPSDMHSDVIPSTSVTPIATVHLSRNHHMRCRSTPAQRPVKPARLWYLLKSSTKKSMKREANSIMPSISIASAINRKVMMYEVVCWSGIDGVECVDGKYIPPQLRAARIGARTMPNSNKDIVDRRIRGLLNRLSEENIKSESAISHTFISLNLCGRDCAGYRSHVRVDGPQLCVSSHCKGDHKGTSFFHSDFEIQERLLCIRLRQKAQERRSSLLALRLLPSLPPVL